MGDGTCPGCDTHHHHRHRYTPLQKVSSSPGRCSYSTGTTGGGTFETPSSLQMGGAWYTVLGGRREEEGLLYKKKAAL